MTPALRALWNEVRGGRAGSSVSAAVPFADIRRRPAEGTGHARISASSRNVRPVEIFSVHKAPDAIRYGDTPARPSRMQIATSLAIAPYKAVMMDDFWLSIIAPNHPAHSLHGPVGRMGERTNIRKPAAEAYGSLVTMDTNPYGQGAGT